MLRARMLCAAVLTLALILGVAASAVYGEGASLQFEAEGNPLANGERGYLSLELERTGLSTFEEPPIVGPGVFCGVIVVANLVANDVPRIEVTDTPPLWEEEGCPGLHDLMFSGEFKGVTYSDTGRGKVRISQLLLTVPGPCLYALAQPAGRFSIPGLARLEGTVHGSLRKGRHCPASRSVPFTVTFIPESLGAVPVTTSF